MKFQNHRSMSRTFITREEILAAKARGETQIVVREDSTVTDEARELATKLRIRLDSVEAPASKPTATPEDIGRRVADAIAAVLAELGLGARAPSLAPILTRRVFARLAMTPKEK